MKSICDKLVIILDYLMMACLGLSIIAVPFWDSIASWKILGNMGKQLSFFPLAFFLLLGLIRAAIMKRMVFPVGAKSFACIVLFVFVLCLSLIANCTSIADNFFKQTSGIAHMRNQMMALMFYIGVSCVAYNIFSGSRYVKYLLWMRKCWYISCVIPICYGILEMGNMIHIDACTALKVSCDMLFRGDLGDYWARLRSVAGEASYLAPYLAAALPWTFSGIASMNKIERYICVIFTALLLTIGYFSFSRTVHIVLIADLIGFGILFRNKIRREWQAYFLCMALSVFFIGSFYACIYLCSFDVISYINGVGYENSIATLNGMENFSNMARYASWIAGLKIFLCNPVLGVGWGQYGFYAADLYPQWAWRSSEIQIWADASSSLWPPVLNLYVKLLAESGLLGTVVWLCFCSMFIKEIYDIGNNSSGGECMYDNAICMLLGSICIMINGFSYDSLRAAPLWIYVGAVWSLLAVQDKKGV